MNQTMKIIKISEIRRLGTEALVKALGPMGMARYIEEYDNGGQGIIQKKSMGSRMILLKKYWL